MSKLDPALKAHLVQRGREIVQRRGIQALVDYEYFVIGCGCMGPQQGEPYCNCRMQEELAIHLLEVVNEIDPDAALMLMRRRIIGALGGGL